DGIRDFHVTGVQTCALPILVPGYVSWRPMWLLAAFWALCLLHLGLELVHAYAWLWLADLPLLALSLFALWRWWPRGPKPGILAEIGRASCRERVYVAWGRG